jgi:hypothetical protein
LGSGIFAFLGFLDFQTFGFSDFQILAQDFCLAAKRSEEKPVNHIGKKRSTASVVLLTLLTCGIYGLYLLYTYSTDINELLGEERISPVLLLILSIFCGPVMLYWTYSMHKALKEIAVLEDVEYRGSFALWLVFTLFFGVGMLVALFQIQETLNSVWDKY